jgi:hypothetical protein
MAEVEAYDVTAVTQGDLETVVSVVTVMAKAYTRGRGFDDTTGAPNDDIAVITTASARLAANGAQLAVDDTAGPFTHSIRGGFQGWTLAERIVLDRYRVKAM